MATIDDLTVKFTADVRDLTNGIKRVESKFVDLERSASNAANKVSSGISGLGKVFTATLVISGARALASYQTALDKIGSELVDMSGRANVGIEALQRLRFAADQNGASSEGMNTALIKLNKAMGEVRGGSEEMSRAFATLGLLDLVKSGASTDQVMMGLADAFSEIKDPALAAAIATKFMGKTGDELVPILMQGSKAVRDMGSALPDFAVVSDEAAHKLDSMADSTEKFNLKTQALAAWLEGGFIDAFNAATDAAVAYWDAMNGGLTSLAESNKPLTALQKNLLAATKATPVVVPEKPKPKVDKPGTKSFFNPAAGGTDDAARAAQQYAEAVADLNFQIEQLGRSEADAAFQEQLRAEISRAGVSADSEKGQEIASLVAQYQALAATNEAIAEQDAANAEAAQKWIDMRDQAGDAVASAFERAILEGEDLRQTISGLIQDLARLIFQKLVFDSISSAVSGGLGGIVGGKALGGTVSPGNSYMVGESGPEVFVPKVPGNIVPNRGGSAGGGGFTYAPVINSNGGDMAQIRQMLAKDKQDLIKLMPKIMIDRQRRNGLGGAFA